MYPRHVKCTHDINMHPRHVDISWVHVVGNIKHVVGNKSWGTSRGIHVVGNIVDVVGNNYYVLDDMYPRHRSICTHDMLNIPTISTCTHDIWLKVPDMLTYRGYMSWATLSMAWRASRGYMSWVHVVGTCRGEHRSCRREQLLCRGCHVSTTS